jgi:hypothetical protein
VGIKFCFKVRKRLIATFLLVSLFCFAPVGQVVADGKISADVSTWATYSNDKYGYEIRYPKELDFQLTGPEDLRDGSQFSITLKNRTMLNGLTVKIHPGKTLEELVQSHWKTNFKELEAGPIEKDFGEKYAYALKMSKESINGKRTVKLELLSKSKKEILSRGYIYDGIYCEFHRYQEFDADTAEKIISSFRFR